MLSADSRGQPTGAPSDTSAVVAVHAWLASAATGDDELSVTVKIREGYHIYASSQPKPFIATRIEVDPSDKVRSVGGFHASHAAHVRLHDQLRLELHEHDGEVTWTANIGWNPSVTAEKRNLQGRIYLQACTLDRCLAPSEIPFVAERRAATGLALRKETALPGVIPAAAPELAPTPGAADVAKTFDLNRLEVEAEPVTRTPWFVVFPAAFLAGLILNLMPCVLPVMGLKLMSFLQQAGDSRRRVFELNLWYSLGLLSVMLVLASLAVFAGLGWGEQFSSVTFNVVLVSVVFVFALSFLGVWEIPLPGFVGVAAGSGLADREGPVGAFTKGVLTTTLATPCSGPLLGPALTWAVTQPAPLTYGVFATVGAGMASPYLLLGAFPGLSKFLPRPGAWMLTFKQAMGFVLLGTVLYLLSFMSIPYVLPTLALLTGLGAACWWVGRLPYTASRPARLRTWATVIAVTTVTGLVAFGWLQGVMAQRFQHAVDRDLAQRKLLGRDEISAVAPAQREIPWRPFSYDLLSQLLAERKTVFVDFTADWCLTCKANETVAINRPEVRNLLQSLGVISLRADKTEPAPEVDKLLRQLGNRAGSIPFYAIFPASNPGQPILLDGAFTSPDRFLLALQQAGPSRGHPAETEKDAETAVPVSAAAVQ